MSKHICDESYKGHEVSYYEDGNWINVDVRIDNFDGEIIASYGQQTAVLYARMKAYGFIDGWIARSGSSI